MIEYFQDKSKDNHLVRTRQDQDKRSAAGATQIDLD